jgi:RNA polymerase sigma factor (sigma-70 family)
MNLNEGAITLPTYSAPNLHAQLVDPLASHYTSNHVRGSSRLPLNSQSEDFPPTRHSIVVAAQSDDPTARSRAMEAIIAAYWKPIYKYVRMKWNIATEDAADFTQEFFTRLLEKEFLASYDAGKGRLRTFLRACADRFFMKQERDSKRLKRGAGSAHLSLNFEEAEQELGTILGSESPEESFDKEWVRSLFSLGVQRLRVNCENGGKLVHFRLFERCDLEDADPKPSYAQLADEFGVAVTDVTNYLAFARREFRRCVLDQLREMTATEEEFRLEAQALLGVDVK